MAARDRLEFADRIKLAKVGARVAKGIPENHFERAKDAGQLILGQVDPPVAPFANATKEGVIRDHIRQVINASRILFVGAWFEHC